MDVNDFKELLELEIKQAGSCYALSKKTGVPASMIHLFYSGKRNIKNMTIGTMTKLFSDLEKSSFLNNKENLEKSSLTSIMESDWKKLDEAERAEAIAAIKRIIKNRPLASLEDKMIGMAAEQQQEYKVKKRKVSGA